MELTQELNNNLLINNDNLTKEQNGFIDSTLGKVINVGLNTGIRMLLPNFLEDEVIKIKDQILKNGFKSGVAEAISAAKDLR